MSLDFPSLWIRICLQLQEKWVRSALQEDSTCHGATKAHAPQPLSLHSRAHELQPLKPMCLEPVLHKRSHRNEKPLHRNEE